MLHIMRLICPHERDVFRVPGIAHKFDHMRMPFLLDLQPLLSTLLLKVVINTLVLLCYVLPFIKGEEII